MYKRQAPIRPEGNADFCGQYAVFRYYDTAVSGSRRGGGADWAVWHLPFAGSAAAGDDGIVLPGFPQA